MRTGRRLAAIAALSMVGVLSTPAFAGAAPPTEPLPGVTLHTAKVAQYRLTSVSPGGGFLDQGTMRLSVRCPAGENLIFLTRVAVGDHPAFLSGLRFGEGVTCTGQVQNVELTLSRLTDVPFAAPKTADASATITMGIPAPGQTIPYSTDQGTWTTVDVPLKLVFIGF